MTDEEKREKRRAYRLANRDKFVAADLKWKYGITVEQYQDLLSKQDYKCAVCFSSGKAGKWPLNVDHCHASGAIRGLLCHHCNLLLGHSKDDELVLLQAAQYLRKSNASRPHEAL